MALGYQRQSDTEAAGMASSSSESSPNYGSNFDQIAALPEPSRTPGFLPSTEGTARADDPNATTPDWATALPEGSNGDAPLDPIGAVGPTTHAPIGIHETDDPPPNSPAGTRTGARDVRILRGPTDPIATSGPKTVQESQLYTERAPSGTAPADGWTPIVSQYGTAEAPFASQSIAPDTLFVDGRVSVADINQGRLGDCALLAALTGIVASDPGKIPSIVHGGGGSASVQMFRYDTAAASWLPVMVAVSLDFLHAEGPQGGPAELLAAAPRVGAAPVRRRWWADLMDDELEVSADEVYEASLWVPALEKAYAVFVERYGQYGGNPLLSGAPQTDPNGAPRSGYDVIDEGANENGMYPLFYGEDATKRRRVGIDHVAGGLGLALNVPILRALVQVDREAPPGEEEAMLTVSTGPDEATERLHQELGYVALQPFMADYPGFAKWLVEMDSLLDAWSAAAPAQQDPLRQQVVDAAIRATVPGAWPVLDSDREGRGFRGLQDLLLMVANIGSGAPSGRSVIALHAYTVLGTTFRSHDGSQLAVTGPTLEAMIPEISPTESRIELRNPHGDNEPDPSGATGGDGVFELDLERFCRMFAAGEYTKVQTES